MPEPRAGDPAPDFTLPGTAGEVRLADALRTGPVVVAFYQEDNTPTCRTQLSALRDDHDLLVELGARVLAISTDPLESHTAFAGLLRPPFPLLADADGAVARAYGVYDEDTRRSRRAVFVIGADGRVLLDIPWYNPANTSQYAQIFRALGMEDGDA
jgi:peroxiredoxin Q/BCP